MQLSYLGKLLNHENDEFSLRLLQVTVLGYYVQNCSFYLLIIQVPVSEEH